MSRPIELFHDLSGAPAFTRPVHLAIGMFDGVHHGHQAVIDAAVHAAGRSGGRSGVLTFDPHPSRLFTPESPTLLIQDPILKMRKLADLNLNFVVVQKFDRQFASIEAQDFLPAVKRALPTLSAVYVGENFRFGKGRRGDVAVLLDSALSLGIRVFSSERVRWNGEPISSTRLREMIQKGEIESANELLGYFYESYGTVVHGRKLGRKMGFPTLNFDWSPECRPRSGVYAVRLRPESTTGQPLPAVANYGLRPTVDGERTVPILEVHSLVPTDMDFGDSAVVEWHKFLRPEMKFESIDVLEARIADDCDTARAFWAGMNLA